MNAISKPAPGPRVAEFVTSFGKLPPKDMGLMLAIMKRTMADPHVKERARQMTEPGLTPDERDRRCRAFVAALTRKGGVT